MAGPLCRRSITVLTGTSRRSSSRGSSARGGATFVSKEVGSSTHSFLHGSMVIPHDEALGPQRMQRVTYARRSETATIMDRWEGKVHLPD